jgi:hypothetical protein
MTYKGLEIPHGEYVASWLITASDRLGSAENLHINPSVSTPVATRNIFLTTIWYLPSSSGICVHKTKHLQTENSHEKAIDAHHHIGQWYSLY